jgi:hypothetical protein
LVTDEGGNSSSDGFPEIVQDDVVYSDPERLDLNEPVDPSFDYAGGGGGGYYEDSMYKHEIDPYEQQMQMQY